MESFNFRNETIEEYLNKLSTSDSVPYGGSVGALSGALGAALTEMVYNITLKKDYTKEDREFLKDSLAELEECRENFLKYCSEDSKNYQILSDALKSDSAKDKKQIEEAAENAIKVPIQVIKNVGTCIELIHNIILYAPKSLTSDINTAVMLFFTCTNNAYENIGANLEYISREKYDEGATRKLVA